MRASALPDVYFSNINKHKSSIIHFLQMSEIFSSSQKAILALDWMAVIFFAILWISLN